MNDSRKIIPIRKSFIQKLVSFFKNERKLAKKYLELKLNEIKKEKE